MPKKKDETCPACGMYVEKYYVINGGRKYHSDCWIKKNTKHVK